MSERDLRTRIAYAIAQADGDLPGMEPDSWDYVLADAVIREIGLAQQSDSSDPVGQSADHNTPPGVRERLTQALGSEEHADAILNLIGLTQQQLTCPHGLVLTRWLTRWEG